MASSSIPSYGECMKARLLLLPLGLLLGSCTGPDGVAPAFQHVSWHLVSLDGAPPPAVIDTGFGRTERLIFDHIRFGDDAIVYRNMRFRLDSVAPGPEYGTETSFEYRVFGETVVIGSFHPCPGGCPPNDTAVIRGDSMVIERSYAHGGGRRVYLPALE